MYDKHVFSKDICIHIHSLFVTMTCHRHVTQNEEILFAVDFCIDFEILQHLDDTLSCLTKNNYTVTKAYGGGGQDRQCPSPKSCDG